MANIFRQSQDINNRPNRNNFDERFQNNLTLKPGLLVPFMCVPTLPGDSFRIQLKYGLKFMPLAFPVQTRMRVVFHFFQSYDRNVWVNHDNFLQGLKEHVHPYIKQPNSFFRTGTLADYLGCPTTVVGSNTVPAHEDWSYYMVDMPAPQSHLSGSVNNLSVQTTGTDSIALEDSQSVQSTGSLSVDRETTGGAEIALDQYNDVPVIEQRKCVFFWTRNASTTNEYNHFSLSINPQESWIIFVETVLRKGITSRVIESEYLNANYWSPFDVAYPRVNIRCGSYTWHSPVLTVNDVEAVAGTSRFRYTIPQLVYDYIVQRDEEIRIRIYWEVYYPQSQTRVQTSDLVDRSVAGLGTGLLYNRSSDSFVGEASDFSVNLSEELKINALPFRHYEAIYNCFYRNWANNPFMINGETAYNRYNTTLEDGPDETDYKLFNRNWEMDYLTSCLPSPQQGVAPLVGMTALGNIDITDSDGVRTYGTYGFESDGKTFNGKISIHNPGESVVNDRILSQDAMAKLGLSINDFRNTNALMHWLEANIRKGYKYKEFIEAHFGKSPSNVALDMPEFIGGFSRPVSVNMISQTSASQPDQPLGSYAGQANAFSNGDGIPSINHYSDDYGFLIGIMCVVPDPAYSQSLPKWMTYRDKLDYYFPEFAQLSMQPVPMKEVAPLQALAEGVSLNKTFGYNRPNYDLVQMTDQVHGQFRTTLRDMLIQRIYGSTPELGEEFLKIKPSEVNNIFTYTAPDEDNIIGQIVIDMKAKRPIPRIHFPSLGR